VDILEWQLLRPIYKRMADNHNAEIFAANTLLVVLGTSLLTARAGLSMALGAFLAGLLLAETEFALQVESDIAPYRGLLLGLFFMTVSALYISGVILFLHLVTEEAL
jgi:Kef-type K+ transport system membrane component KefB